MGKMALICREKMFEEILAGTKTRFLAGTQLMFFRKGDEYIIQFLHPETSTLLKLRTILNHYDLAENNDAGSAYRLFHISTRGNGTIGWNAPGLELKETPNEKQLIPDGFEAFVPGDTEKEEKK